MATILLSGASGYIGRRFALLAQQAGHTVVALGRPAFPGQRAWSWRLGEGLPSEAIATADVLVHAAQDWRDPPSNFAGTLALARAMPGRFVFVSSVSAHAGARNAYGRVKLATEKALMAECAGRAVSARLGLVFGGVPAGQYALMRRITAMTPLLPMLGLARPVQPIHLDEACEGLLMLATGPMPDQDIYAIAGPAPLSFRAWLKLLRRAQMDRALWTLPVPLWAGLAGAALVNALPFGPRIDRERILGLAGSIFSPSSEDLRKLGMRVQSPARHLLTPRRAQRAFVTEAFVLLHYMRGCRPRRQAVARLARALAARSETPFCFSPLIRRWPALLRLRDPVSPRPENALGRHLHYAAMVVEADSCPPVPGRRISGLLQLPLEALAFPLRLLVGQA